VCANAARMRKRAAPLKTTDAASADRALLDRLQQDTFAYFLSEVNPANGLVADKTSGGSPASIAATGLALTAYPVAVERGFMTRAQAVRVTLATLRFFRDSPHGPEPDATGYKGFYYHFLDMKTGRRAWRCELSTIDTTFLLAGALTAAAYFDRDTEQERQIRSIADYLYRRADWRWAQNGGPSVSHGWRPERGFIRYRWQGYNEALLLYVLGLGSPTFALPDESYPAWLSTYKWKKLYGYEFVYGAPLFVHQLSHVWIDFRGIQDAYVRTRGTDYFENSRRASYVQQAYAIRNPRGFTLYGEVCWGITASDGPGPTTIDVRGRTRRFFGYVARGVPYGPDDGTLSPWAVVASLPFAPAIVLPAVRYFEDVKLRKTDAYGFKASFNPSFPAATSEGHGWISQWEYGLNEGPVVLMIENFRSGLVWRLTRGCPYIATGLRRAGFRGGWL
jgi:hypothetical protein